MGFRKPGRLTALISALVMAMSALFMPFSVVAAQSSITISEQGPYSAVDTSLSVGTGEWRANVQVTPQANGNGTPANASFIFGYVDAQNYYYANYAANAGAGLNGVYKVTNGVRSTVATYTAAVVAGQSHELELRHKDGAIRVYLGSTFLYKTSSIAVAGTKLGVGTVNGGASFTNAAHSLSSVTTALNLTLIGGETPPPATSSTVAITSPVNGATVSGTPTITATASDAQGINSVQFKVDGVNLGADTTTPYTASWDTTAIANGSHSLTAIATNVAANSTTSAAVAVMVNNQVTQPPAASGFTITEGGQNAGIDTTLSTAGASEWRLSSQMTPSVASGNTTPANSSLLWGYVDAQNYYYANFATGTGAGLSGVYRVTNGTSSKVLSLTNFIPANQSTSVELRYKDNDVRIYINGTYITKATEVGGSGTKVGVATQNATASFVATTLKLGTPSYALSLSPTTVEATPFNAYTCLPPPSQPTRITSIGRQVAVSTSAELKAAIVDAQPGDTIVMADGTYSDAMLVGNYTGSFSPTADGDATNPITLTGSAGAIIDGNGTSGRYGLYLAGAHYWNLVGFTVANASKGIVLDGSSHAFIENVTVQNIGQEAVHFRAFSSNNVIKNSHISGTGKSSPQFGEGVYIGSANSNWGTYTNGQPDTSNNNIVIGNSFEDFSAEAIDIKEGTTANYIANNTFEGSSISGLNSADSWVDVKGNCTLLEGNVGTNTLLDGFQVHNVYQQWGAYNVFRNNIANVNASGYGFSVDFNSLDLGNVFACNNTAVAAGAGSWNIPCSEQN